MSDQNEAVERLTDLLQDIGRRVAKALGEAVRPFGLSGAQADVLELLWARGRLQPRDLIDARGVESASMGATLTRLERDGLIEKTKATGPDADKRGVWIVATPKAEALCDQVRAAVAAVEATLAVDSAAIDALRGVRDRLEANAAAKPDRPGSGKA